MSQHPDAGEPTPWIAPAGESLRVVIVTGSDRVHQRFADQLGAQLGPRAAGWVQLAPQAGRGLAADLVRSGLKAGGEGAITGLDRVLNSRVARSVAPAALRTSAAVAVAEQRLFRHEPSASKAPAALRPMRCAEADAQAAVARLQPTLILVFNTGRADEPVPTQAGAAALQWRCGPGSGGAPAIERAVRAGDLAAATSRVHVVGSDLVLAESVAAFVEDDTPEACFARTAALGAVQLGDAVAGVLRGAPLSAWRPSTAPSRDAAAAREGEFAGLIGQAMVAKLAF